MNRRSSNRLTRHTAGGRQPHALNGSHFGGGHASHRREPESPAGHRGADAIAAEGRRRDPRHRREVRRQPGDRHRVDDGADRRSVRAAPASVRSLRSSYDSGAGNGPFGFGWSLVLAVDHAQDRQGPAADTATPTSRTSSFSSGAEDLVPVLSRTATWASRRTALARRSRGYRFAATGRASRACSRASSAGRASRPATSHGARSRRTTSRRCTATDSRSRIVDPADPRRIFSWLICESYDDKGNVIVYEYKRRRRRRRRPVRSAHERNRGAATSRDRQPLPQAHPLRQPRASADACGRPARPARRSTSDWCSRWSSTTASTIRDRRRRRDDSHRARGRAATIRSRPTAPASRCAPTASASAC